MINYHPDEMMPDEFWQLAFEKSKDIPFGLLPHKISRCFNSETIKRIEKAFNNNISATTSIGALCSNVLLCFRSSHMAFKRYGNMLKEGRYLLHILLLSIKWTCLF